MNKIQDHPDYWLFHSMKKRCNNPNYKHYCYYGGKGVKVCARWMEPRGAGFKNFLEDMGPRPLGLTLDRKNGDGDYEPSNCRWATKQEQVCNRKANIFIEWNGENLTLTQWAKRVGVRGGDVIKKRIAAGVPLEIALTAKNLQNPKKYIYKAIEMAAQLKRQQTECKNKHPLSGDNLYISENGYRTCRQCKREAMALKRKTMRTST